MREFDDNDLERCAGDAWHAGKWNRSSSEACEKGQRDGLLDVVADGILLCLGDVHQPWSSSTAIVEQVIKQ